jgi:VCBS repeat protein/all-beta uncharacterized protein/S-layer family protein
MKHLYKQSIVLLALALISIAMIQFPLINRITASGGAALQSEKPELARLGERVSIRAAGRGNSHINLSDGRDVITGYSGPDELVQLMEESKARPLALASADFDEDGITDLIGGYAGSEGGIITIHRGNVDSIYPNAPEAKQRKAEGTFTDSPFLSPARAFAVPEAADFIAAGDFDGDSNRDVVAAARGGDRLYLLSGDGDGRLRQAKPIKLPGGVTAMAVGEVNRRDGLDEVVVGIASSSGPKVLMFEGKEGALKAYPEVFALPAEATSLAFGQLNDSSEIDLAVAAGHDLLIIHGRDRNPWLNGTRRGMAPSSRISQRSFPFAITSIVIGDFTGRHRPEIALLSADGIVRVLGPGDANKQTGEALGRWQLGRKVYVPGAVPLLVSARVSSRPLDELVTINSVSNRLSILTCGEGRERNLKAHDVMSSFSPWVSASLDAESQPVAALPMRLNGDALSDLVVLKAGQISPAVVMTQAVATFTVTNTDDSGAGSMRQAILDANANNGADMITFSIESGVKTITPTSALPTITESVTIDGTTQPGPAGTPLIELNGEMAGSNARGLVMVSGTSTIKALVINRFGSNGIRVESDFNNIEGNYIGVDVTGTKALPNGNGASAFGINIVNSRNVIGGTSPNARNIVSGNFSGIRIEGSENRVEGNYIGTDVSGTLPLGNGTCGGIEVRGPRNTIGGDTAAARNIISGNTNMGIQIDQQPAKENLVQGNYVGVDASGALALSNQNSGIIINDAPGNMIGGTTPGARNIISANGQKGINIGFPSCFFSPGQKGVIIQGNYIGTDVAGTGDLGNSQDGVFVENNSLQNTVIDNIIAFNGGKGVHIPDDPSMPGIPNNPGLQIDITNNSIFSNTGLSIDLGPSGVTPNDPRDPDLGANLLQNFPALTSATTASNPTTTATIRIIGNLHSTPNRDFYVYFYSMAECLGINPEDNQQSINFLPILFHTDENGNAPIDVTFVNVPIVGNWINALARDSNDNTSEFSQCILLNGAASCNYSIGSAGESFPPGGGTGSVSVTAGGGCVWTAVSEASFITITAGPDGTGNGTVSYRVNANTDSTERTGTMTIAGQTFTVTQGGATTPCMFSLSPADRIITAEGGSGSFTVNTQGGCNWTAFTDVGWISTGSTGSGFGQVSYFVSENTTEQRTGHITVEGHQFTVTQDGATSVCTYSLSPTFVSLPASGGAGSFTLTTQVGCTWNAAADVPWITVPTSGAGGGAINYTVGPNGGPPRTGHVFIGGESFTIEQAASCSFTLGAPSVSFTASGGTGSVTVTAANGCTWTATSNNRNLISVTGGSIGTGTGTVTFTVAANTATTIRSGTIRIAGQTFTVVQGAAFLDVPVGHLFYEQIGKLSARGVTVGCGNGNFCPEAAVTREQMAAFIIRAMGEFNPPAPPNQQFNDVPPSNLFYNFIGRMAALGITSGCSASPPLYCPGATVTREQMAAFIIRGIGEFNPPVPGSQRFNDVPSTNLFYNFIDRMAVLGITSGCSTSPPLYCPSATVTRGQMAVFIVRAFNL